MMTVLDLFSGCGGLSVGFEQAGFKVIAGVDYDEAALNTFKHNHRGSHAIHLDLSKDDAMEQIRTRIGYETQIDLIAGGPPCQGFSLTGPRKLKDKRNKLYMSMLSAVKEFSPSAFLIENVRGMAGLYQGKVLKDIVTQFDKAGYNVEHRILNAADYGVPQVRNRLFIVGIRKDIGNFEFPESTHRQSDWVTCEEAISDLPTLENDLGSNESKYEGAPISDFQRKLRGSCNVLYNHLGTRHTELVKSVIAQVPEGGNHKDLPPGVGESRKFNEAWTRYHSQRPSRTIDTGHRNHFHYRWNRVPTVRENARLQSFNDEFEFLGTKTQQNRQVGNAVPPLLARALGRQIMLTISPESFRVVMPYMFEYSDVENVNAEDLRKVITWIQNQFQTQSEQLEEVMQRLEKIESELTPSKKKRVANAIIKGVFTTALANLG
ncbi:MAG: DNA cytosine methyltransferase [Candidatus Poseidoniaceae archaeon]